ncbi:MAG: hypothetical protein GWN58_33745 [Anaerolineae bacterium]|nr:hypothetical protein [Thermoplasmata archaeon]NIV34242.1 hypothetical protein [Anaerolineae bacterium]NIY06090.1 hypothetical protein [Thermoplasmata archaeon]
MTDRYHTLTVVLERDTREDDAEHLINAIRMMRGVRSVTGEVANMETHMAEERARHELGQKILDVLYPDRRKS